MDKPKNHKIIASFTPKQYELFKKMLKEMERR